MTLSTTSSRISYAGDGSTVAFSFPYYFLANADLIVKKQNTTTGVVTAMVITTDYTITGAGVAAGGTVTCVAAPASGYNLIIYRDPTITQDLHFVENDPLPVVQLEKRLDKLTMFCQRLSNRVDRAIVLDDGYSSAFTQTMPSLLVADTVLQINDAGTGWTTGPTANNISSAQNYAITALRWATYTAGTVVDASTLVDSGDYSSKNYAIGTLAGVGGSSKDWAQKTSAAVTGSSYSAKEWAVGTQTRGVASSGSAKDWATYTSAVVDDTSYSAKEYAMGTQASTGGSSKTWATQTGSKVQTVDYSAKEWAIGTTGRGAASSGSAKDWATYTGAVVDDTSYSAKEYAQGTTAAVAGSAKDWAQKTSAAVTGTSYSAKEWALGTQTRGAASGGSAKDWAVLTGTTADDTSYSAKEHAVGTTVTTGSAKDWATKTSSTVIASNYSAKEWAVGTQTRGAASSGSSKDWATYTGGTVDDAGYSAKQWAMKATTTVDGSNYSAYQYALNAAASAASITLTTKGDLLTYSTVMTRLAVGATNGMVFTTDSSAATGNKWNYPFPTFQSKTTTYSGALGDDVVLADTSGGAWTLTIPTAVGNTGKQYHIKKTTNDGNILTITPTAGSIDGATSFYLCFQYDWVILKSDGTNWYIIAGSDTAIEKQNLIIGGNFDFWQRGTSFASIGAGTYTADRFVLSFSSSTGVFTVSRQGIDSNVLSGGGVQSTYYWQLAVGTADTSIAAGEYARLDHYIEGYNYAMIAGRPFSIGFWTKHHRTGIYCVAVQNSGQDRSYVQEYTQSVADTWEYKTVIFPASPTAGTWDYTTGVGLRVFFAMASGSTYQTTANAWQTGNYFATSNQVNAIGATSDFFRIGQIQVCVGNIPKRFSLAGKNAEGELLLCKRYYNRPHWDSSTTAAQFCTGGGIGATQARCLYIFPVSMRTIPNFGNSTASKLGVSTLVADVALTAISSEVGSTESMRLLVTVAAGLTLGSVVFLIKNTDVTGYIEFLCEL